MKKRIICLALVLSFLLSSSAFACYSVSSDSAYSVADSYNSKTYDIYKTFTTIYDRNNIRLNNNTKSIIAVIKPDEKNMNELSRLFNSDSINEIRKELSSGEVVIRPIDKYADVEFIRLVEKVNENDVQMLCRHLIDRNYGGIESAIGGATGGVSINYSVDALGRVLAGDNGRLKSVKDNTSVKISVDSEIQKIAEESARSIAKGAVVITDVDSSQILAMYSAGNDFLNRAASSFAVGSIFKLVVTAAALENNIAPDYTCKNSITVGDTTFHCQNKKEHGKQTLKQALANSCNCYFINLSLKLGAEKIYSMAESFGFMQDIEPYPDYVVKAGAFASPDTLKSKGQLALIGFGQGELTDSPLHFSSVISTIANGGIYKSPTLSLDNKSGTRIISKSTCESLREYMHYVVTDGTGANANYNNNSSGKTATAQSGMYDNGKEILNTYFAGFYPYDNPKYSIVVMCEDGNSGAVDCCPIFSTIVEKLDNL